MQSIFNYILTQLNANAVGLTYAGNYIFRFFEEKMSVLEAVTGKLVNDEIDITPVSILTKVPIPFVESNKRIDWMLELGFLVRIQGSEYDSTTDLDFANIQSVLTTLHGSVVTSGGKRYAFKTQEPNYSGSAFLGKSKYAIITTTLNICEITYGYFGTDSVWAVDSATLDTTNVTITSTRRYYTSAYTDDTDNDFNTPVGRALVFEITFNYNGETELLKERKGTQTLAKTYTLKETFNTTDSTSYTVTCESATENQVKGAVKQLTCRFIEV
jgi:hypothetical protein